MKINDVIRTRRQELGLTQEALADKLGVSPPAVNKWERGLNYPDITLLPALARTLGVDLNTLLSFQEDMSREEIGLFVQEVVEKARSAGCAAAFHMARSKLWEFPQNDLLASSLAAALEGILALYPDGGEEDRRGWEQEVAELYERAGRSVDPQIREWAAYIAASRCLGRGELERAEALLAQLSESHRGKQALTARLRQKQGRSQEAWVLLETALFSCANEVQALLLQMVELALSEGDRDRAGVLTDYASAAGRCLDFPGCSVLSGPFQLAMADKDGPRALALLEKLLSGMTIPWNWRTSPLYCHMPAKEDTGKTQKMLIGPLLDQLETAPEGLLLKDVPGYQELVEKYRSAGSE